MTEEDERAEAEVMRIALQAWEKYPDPKRQDARIQHVKDTLGRDPFLRLVEKNEPGAVNEAVLFLLNDAAEHRQRGNVVSFLEHGGVRSVPAPFHDQ